MPTRSAIRKRPTVEKLSIGDLRKVTKPNARRGQAKYKAVEGDRVVDKVTKDRLSGIVTHVVIPWLEKGHAVQVRWSHLNRPGMTPWVEVVPEREVWVEQQPMSPTKEPDLGVKDGHDLLHIIPRGNMTTTRCGLDSDYFGIPVSLDAPLEHCLTCWSTEPGGRTVPSVDR
jgi:hypothetical protein